MASLKKNRVVSAPSRTKTTAHENGSVVETVDTIKILFKNNDLLKKYEKPHTADGTLTIDPTTGKFTLRLHVKKPQESEETFVLSDDDDRAPLTPPKSLSPEPSPEPSPGTSQKMVLSSGSESDSDDDQRIGSRRNKIPQSKKKTLLSDNDSDDDPQQEEPQPPVKKEPSSLSMTDNIQTFGNKKDNKSNKPKSTDTGSTKSTQNTQETKGKSQKRENRKTKQQIKDERRERGQQLLDKQKAEIKLRMSNRTDSPTLNSPLQDEIKTPSTHKRQPQAFHPPDGNKRQPPQKNNKRKPPEGTAHTDAHEGNTDIRVRGNVLRSSLPPPGKRRHIDSNSKAKLLTPQRKYNFDNGYKPTQSEISHQGAYIADKDHFKHWDDAVPISDYIRNTKIDMNEYVLIPILYQRASNKYYRLNDYGATVSANELVFMWVKRHNYRNHMEMYRTAKNPYDHTHTMIEYDETLHKDDNPFLYLSTVFDEHVSPAIKGVNSEENVYTNASFNLDHPNLDEHKIYDHSAAPAPKELAIFHMDENKQPAEHNKDQLLELRRKYLQQRLTDVDKEIGWTSAPQKEAIMHNEDTMNDVDDMLNETEEQLGFRLNSNDEILNGDDDDDDDDEILRRAGGYVPTDT